MDRSLGISKQYFTPRNSRGVNLFVISLDRYLLHFITVTALVVDTLLQIEICYGRNKRGDFAMSCLELLSHTVTFYNCNLTKCRFQRVEILLPSRIYPRAFAPNRGTKNALTVNSNLAA